MTTQELDTKKEVSGSSSGFAVSLHQTVTQFQTESHERETSGRDET